MFDFSQILEFAKVEPGHGLLQSVLLFMIYLQSKGLNKELKALRGEFSEAKSFTDQRFTKLEDRVLNIEKRGL